MNGMKTFGCLVMFSAGATMVISAMVTYVRGWDNWLGGTLGLAICGLAIYLLGDVIEASERAGERECGGC